jgi:hypothetical protein
MNSRVHPAVSAKLFEMVQLATELKKHLATGVLLSYQSIRRSLSIVRYVKSLRLSIEPSRKLLKLAYLMVHLHVFPLDQHSIESSRSVVSRTGGVRSAQNSLLTTLLHGLDGAINTATTHGPEGLLSSVTSVASRRDLVLTRSDASAITMRNGAQK